MDNLRFARLWDIYNRLLTPTQREITDLHFNLDLTVSEIAEQKGISRQAVSDCISSGKKQLEYYEDKLGFYKTLNGLTEQNTARLKDIAEWSERFFAAHPELAEEKKSFDEILKPLSQ